MLARGQWRVRRVDYENAPFGREEHAASPYRWLLGLIAWADHAVSGRPFGTSVERAALFADPLLHMMLLAGAATFAAWQLGVFPAAVLSLGLVALFPFASEFLPGAPGDHGLAQACAIWSVLPLLAGVSGIRAAEADSSRRARRWFLVAGIAGGVGLWVSVVHEVPVLMGIALGALLAAVAARGESAGAGAPGDTPWRTWALGGAATSCVAYLVEFFPSHMGSLQLRAVHPLYGLAWLGGGEVLAQAAAWIRQRRPETGPPGFGGRVLAADAIAAEWIRRRRPRRSLRDDALGALALLALLAVPVAMWRSRDLGFMGLDASALRLTRLAHGPAATGLLEWVLHDGASVALLATLLPLLLVLPAIWLLARHGAAPAARASICIAIGPGCPGRARLRVPRARLVERRRRHPCRPARRPPRRSRARPTSGRSGLRWPASRRSSSCPAPSSSSRGPAPALIPRSTRPRWSGLSSGTLRAGWRCTPAGATRWSSRRSTRR